jgi:hypothetical protein
MFYVTLLRCIQRLKAKHKKHLALTENFHVDLGRVDLAGLEGREREEPCSPQPHLPLSLFQWSQCREKVAHLIFPSSIRQMYPSTVLQNIRLIINIKCIFQLVLLMVYSIQKYWAPHLCPSSGIL